MRASAIPLLIGGQFFSQVCDRMASIGMIWVITEHFGASWVPWYLALGGLPHLLFSTLSSQVIARAGEFKVLIFTDFARSIVFALALAALFWIKGSLLTNLFVLVFVTNIAASFFNPAILSLPRLMSSGEKLQRLTALINFCFSISIVLGPLAAALIYKAWGLEGVLALTGLAYFVAGLCNLGARLAYINPLRASAPLEQDNLLKTRLQLGTDPLIRSMLGGFLAINILVAPLPIAIPIFAKEKFLGNIHSLAWLEGTFGLGMVIASLVLSAIKIPANAYQKISLSLVLMSLGYAAFAFSPALSSAGLSLFVMGFFNSAANIWILALFQERPPTQQVPSLMALVNLISVASLPLSMSLTGLLTKQWPLSLILSTSSLLFIALAVVISLKLLSGRHLIPPLNTETL